MPSVFWLRARWGSWRIALTSSSRYSWAPFFESRFGRSATIWMTIAFRIDATRSFASNHVLGYLSGSKTPCASAMPRSRSTTMGSGNAITFLLQLFDPGFDALVATPQGLLVVVG